MICATGIDQVCLQNRIAHMDETDAVVTEWTCTLPKMEVFARAKANRVPCAPVRTPPEVMHDPHMHERGMLEEIEHPELAGKDWAHRNQTEWVRAGLTSIASRS